MALTRTLLIGWLLLSCAVACSFDFTTHRDERAGLKRARMRPLPGPNAGDAGTAVPGDAASARDGSAPNPACVDYRGDGWNGEQGEQGPIAPHPPSPDAGEVDPSAPFALTSGPIVGDITDTSAKIWIRGDRPVSWDLRIWPLNAPEQETRVHGAALTFDDDLTSVVRVDDLQPAHRYGYEVDLFAADGSAVTNAGSGSLRTLPPAGQPIKLRFAVGADIAGSRPQPIFARIESVAPDFMLLIGDQIYADEVSLDASGYEGKYRNNWGIPELNALMSNVPVEMMWDDHDITDNYFMGSDTRYVFARRAFELYGAAHNPRPFRPGVLYYTLRAGDVAFFVLDVRSFRSPQVLPDGADKTMLGAEQKQDLLSWLSCEPAAIKVIVSPVIFSDWAQSGSDAWRGYAYEREQLFAFIVDHGIDDVLIVSGDQHWSAVFREARGDYAFYEFLPTPLSKGRNPAPQAPSDEILARDDDQFVFGVVDIDTTVKPAAIALTLCRGDQPCSPGREPAPGTGLDVEGAEENVPFTVQLTSDQLGFRH
jgi:alkaline phosphatase D